jgi:type II secretory pathway pseudopilin PulG
MGRGGGALPRLRPVPPVSGKSVKASERGMTLVELLVLLSLLGLLLAIGLPRLFAAAGGVTVRLAADEVLMALRETRIVGLRLGTYVGVKFRRDADGNVTYTLHRDGDGDGIRTADIESGVDPALGPPRRLQHFGRTVRFGFPPGPPPRDPGDPSRRLDHLDDPIRFNRSDIASFSPLEGATPGTVYLTDGERRLAAVRVTGRTGRTRILVYDPVGQTWR